MNAGVKKFRQDFKGYQQTINILKTVDGTAKWAKVGNALSFLSDIAFTAGTGAWDGLSNIVTSSLSVAQSFEVKAIEEIQSRM